VHSYNIEEKLRKKREEHIARRKQIEVMFVKVINTIWLIIWKQLKTTIAILM